MGRKRAGVIPAAKSMSLAMPIKYKIDILAALKDKGVSTYKIRKEKLLSESTLQNLRNGSGISWDSLETICSLLGCQPGDLIEFEE